MTQEDLDFIKSVHEKLEKLESAGLHDEAEMFYQKNRLAFRWDSKGNWVGSIPNENGWTA